MTVRVLLFSVLRDIAGAEELDFEVPVAVADVGGLLDACYQRWPALEEWDDRIRIAVDRAMVGRDHPLAAGQEIALMPPFQGG